jgi:hypothetical protein
MKTKIRNRRRIVFLRKYKTKISGGRSQITLRALFLRWFIEGTLRFLTAKSGRILNENILGETISLFFSNLKTNK